MRRKREGGQGGWLLKEITHRYPEEYLWRERNGKDKPNAFIKISSNIAGNITQGTVKATQTYNIYQIFYIKYIFKTIQSEVISYWLI